MLSRAWRAARTWLRAADVLELRNTCLVGLALVTGLLFTTLTWAAPVRAQQAISIATLQIGIWPEYDRPSVLVILDGQLSAGVALPAQVSLHMPAAAKAPNAVAVTAPDGNLVTAPYTTTTVSSGDIIITFQASTAAFRLEYYDPGLIVSGDARSFAFRWQSDYAIGAATLKVQEPAGAHDLKGQPALTAVGAGGDGLNYYTASLGALARSSTVSLDLSYAKSGNALSATAIGPTVTGGTPATAPAATTSGLPSTWPWIAGGAVLGLALVSGGVTLYLRQNRPARSSRSTRRARRAPSRASQTAASRSGPPVADVAVSAAPATTKLEAGTTIKDAPTSFCTHCGQRHQPGDRFCRKCGTPVRE